MTRIQKFQSLTAKNSLTDPMYLAALRKVIEGKVSHVEYMNNCKSSIWEAEGLQDFLIEQFQLEAGIGLLSDADCNELEEYATHCVIRN